jgi:hypothetical protein
MTQCSATTQKGSRCSRNACIGDKCRQHRKSENIKLLKVEKANDGKHKFVAIFDVNGKEKRTKFGAEGYGDFIIFTGKEGKESGLRHRENYIRRHTKDLHTKDFTRAGTLSMFILWGNKPNLEASIKDYKRRMNEIDFTLPNK